MTDNSPELMLRVRDVSLDYEAMIPRRGRQKSEVIGVHALHEIGFDGHRGEGIALVGHNGAGKSTLLQVVAGFLRPNKGEVKAVSQPTFLERSAALKAGLDGHHNIRLGLLANGLARDQVAEVAPRVAEFCELGDALDRPIRGYSSGMKARLGFSIATAVDPEILLLDEALAVGDSKFKKKALERMREIIENAGLFLMATHAPGEIRKTCTRVLWLEQGRIVMDGPPKEVMPEFNRYMGDDDEMAADERAATERKPAEQAEKDAVA